MYCCYSKLPVELYQLPVVLCYNCCRYGHTKTKCRSKPRCFKCGGNHSSDSCTIQETEACCFYCSGHNYVSNRSCPEYIRQKNIKAVMAERCISFEEASKQFRAVSRSYADVSASVPHKLQASQNPNSQLNNSPSTFSYRKTVTFPKKSHAPLSPGYDKQAHQAILKSFSIPSSSNGTALQNTSPPSSKDNTSVSIIELLLSLISSLISKNNLSLPDLVAAQLTQLTNSLSNVSSDLPSVER